MDIMLQCCCIESMYRGCSRTGNCDIMLQCCCIESMHRGCSRTENCVYNVTVLLYRVNAKRL